MTLASMLRIPVCMHNLPDESIFRPAAWRMYGTHEAMSADFRACATYGPLYGPYLFGGNDYGNHQCSQFGKL